MGFKRIMYGQGETNDYIRSLEVSHQDHEVLNHAETNLPIEPKRVNAGRQRKCSGYHRCSGCNFEQEDPECHCVTRCHKRTTANGICGKPECQHIITIFKNRFNTGTQGRKTDFQNFRNNNEAVRQNPEAMVVEERVNLEETKMNLEATNQEWRSTTSRAAAPSRTRDPP